MTHKEIIDRAIILAQESAQTRVWKIGDIASHPDQPIVCKIEEIVDDIAIIGWKSIRERVPLEELFDPNDAKHFALCINAGLDPDHTMIVSL